MQNCASSFWTAAHRRQSDRVAVARRRVAGGAMKLAMLDHRHRRPVEPAAPAVPWSSTTTPRGLRRQLADVICDVPWFLVTPLLRRWHLTWGATPDEAAAAMP